MLPLPQLQERNTSQSDSGLCSRNGAMDFHMVATSGGSKEQKPQKDPKKLKAVRK